MAIIKVQQAPKKKSNPEDLIALFCYHFPQYTFAQARKMPYKRIRQMLRVANKEYARQMLDLVSIIAAPHTKNGKLVKSLSEKFNAIINE